MSIVGIVMDQMARNKYSSPNDDIHAYMALIASDDSMIGGTLQNFRKILSTKIKYGKGNRSLLKTYAVRYLTKLFPFVVFKTKSQNIDK